jgi:hypothetical protein
MSVKSHPDVKTKTGQPWYGLLWRLVYLSLDLSHYAQYPTASADIGVPVHIFHAFVNIFNLPVKN